MISFEYFEGEMFDISQDCIKIELCNKIISKNHIFKVYSKKLYFPDYFGHNWDAFQECLEDLSWLKGKSIVIIHYSIPNLSEAELDIYLSILVDLKEVWNEDDFLKIAFYFPRINEYYLSKYF